jgi:hypothetical protein
MAHYGVKKHIEILSLTNYALQSCIDPDEPKHFKKMKLKKNLQRFQEKYNYSRFK